MVMIDSPITPKLSAKYPRATLTINNVGVYGINVQDFCTCLIITAMVKPKKRKSRAKAYFETYPTIIFVIILLTIFQLNLP